MAPEIGYGLLTLIQERASEILKPDTPTGLTITTEAPLLALLQNGGVDLPGGFGVDLSALLDQVTSNDVVGDDRPDSVLDRVRGKLSGFGQTILAGQGLSGLRDAVHGVVAALPAAASSRSLVTLVGSQAAIGISFVTTLRNLATPDLATKIPEGWARYFFAEKGFETVDGISIISPGHGSLSAALSALSGESLKQLKGLISERSANQYVRDLIRITIEVAADTRYGDIPKRYRALLALLTDAAGQAKAARWFRGFGSLAESLVTSAVEEAVLGVSQFQTNPVLAAAAASYAGTVARKATQHVFLREAGV